jgi:hypothetical protein
MAEDQPLFSMNNLMFQNHGSFTSIFVGRKQANATSIFVPATRDLLTTLGKFGLIDS